MKIDQLTNIFTSRPGLASSDRQTIHDINFLLEHGYLHVSKNFFCNKKTFLDTLEKIQTGDIAIFDVDGGKTEHMALKAIAKDKYGNKQKMHIEETFHGRIPDALYIIDDDIHIIECGNTDERKIFEYFKNLKVKEVSIVPFPYAEDDALCMYTFLPSDNLSEFIEFWEQEKRNNLKILLKKNVK